MLPKLNNFSTLMCSHILLFLSFSQATSAQQPPITLDLSGYEISFSDEFDSEIDVTARGPSKWIAHKPDGQNFGDAQFVDPRPGFPFAVNNGILNISVAKNMQGQWEGGIISSVDFQGRGFAQKFGYFEARMKLPYGAGLWPAFWLLAQDHILDPKIHDTEVDILEHYGIFPHEFCFNYHNWAPAPERKHSGLCSTPEMALAGNLNENFHRYGVLITEEYISYYLDGIELHRMITPPEAKRPLFVLINLAMGGGWPIDENLPSPSTLEVDYLRVYQHVESNTQRITSQFSNLCAEISGLNADQGIEQQTCSDSEQQKFSFDAIPHSDAKQIKSVASNLCLEQNIDNLSIVQSPCDAEKLNQYWMLNNNSHFEIFNISTRRCMNVAYNSKAIGGAWIGYRCGGGYNERFLINATNEEKGDSPPQLKNALILPVISELCGEVSGVDGKAIAQQICNGEPSQSFSSNLLDDGSYTMSNDGTDLCLSENSSSLVVQSPCNPSQQSQRWHIIPESDYIRIINLESERCLTVSHGSTETGRPWITYQCSGGYNERFRFF